MRIFPFVNCNYNCDYCTVYTGLKQKPKYDLLAPEKWIESIKRAAPFFKKDFQIVISGGEPTMYRDFVKLCDGLNGFNVVVYTNLSPFAHEKLMQLEHPVKIYPSFHNRQEGGDLKGWLSRLMDIKKQGHYICLQHAINDGSEGIETLPDFIIKPNLEGYLDGKYHSPYVNECRVDGKELRKVRCATWQFAVAPDGDIYNCQSGFWKKESYYRLGNIQTIEWEKFPQYIECEFCGLCHVCAAGKVIAEMDGKAITDKWQYIPALQKDEQFIYKYTTTIERGSMNE